MGPVHMVVKCCATFKRITPAHRLALGVSVLAGLHGVIGGRLLTCLHALQLPLQRPRILLQPPEVVLPSGDTRA